MADLDNVPDDFATLFVTNLPPVEEEVREIFADCGTIVSLRILPQKDDRDTRAAIIIMASGAEARDAIQKLTNKDVNGRRLRIKFDERSLERRLGPGGGGDRGGGGFGGGSDRGSSGFGSGNDRGSGGFGSGNDRGSSGFGSGNDRGSSSFGSGNDRGSSGFGSGNDRGNSGFGSGSDRGNSGFGGDRGGSGYGKSNVENGFGNSTNSAGGGFSGGSTGGGFGSSSGRSFGNHDARNFFSSDSNKGYGNSDRGHSNSDVRGSNNSDAKVGGNANGFVRGFRRVTGGSHVSGGSGDVTVSGGPTNFEKMSETAGSEGSVRTQVQSPDHSLVDHPDHVLPVQDVIFSEQKELDAARTYLANMMSLYQSKERTDFTFTSSDNKEYPAHQAILGAHCTAFATMLQNGTQEQESGKCHVTDVDGETLDALLLYLYALTIPDLDAENLERAEKLLVAADKYQLPGLKEACEVFLQKNVKLENAASLLVLGDQHSAGNLKLEAMKCIKVDLYSFVKNGGLKDTIQPGKEWVEELLLFCSEDKKRDEKADESEVEETVVE